MEPQPASRLGRITILTYGVLCYLYFFGTFLYSIAFLANFDGVPKTIDSGSSGPIGIALLINLGLLSIFAVQHSVMARPEFKRLWHRIVPEPAERSTYVLLSSLSLTLLYVYWQPMSTPVWQITNMTAVGLVVGLYFFGWGLLLYATALIDHFDLFGVRQAWLAFRGRPYLHHPFATPGLYKHIRHPLYVAWAVIFWATPEMSVGHLFFAIVTTVYMVLAVFVEERDLLNVFGDAYRRYQETTPKYLIGTRPAGALPKVVSRATVG